MMRRILGIHVLLIIISLSAVPLYASEINQEAASVQPAISALTEEEIKSSHTIIEISPLQRSTSLVSEKEFGYRPSLIEEYSNNEVAVNAVSRHITLFTERIKEKFSLWLSRSGRYLEMMREILKEKNVPEEIVFLSLIESGFNPKAYSPARAAGYWQFIASTAKRYGLQINWWRDERRDPVKSTVAAANYLKDLYEMFGSWNLAMAAYNAGEGKILKALNRTKADDYWALLSTSHIKRETKDYVPKFIAASLIAYSPENYGFDDLEYHPPLNYDVVTLRTPVDLEIIAECAGTTVEAIRDLNPELRRWCTPPDVSEYALRVPEGKKEVFLENLSAIPEEKLFTVDTYTVKKKDTFKTISRKTGVPVQVILDLNDMEKIIPLKAGAKLYLPPKGKFVLDKDDRARLKKASFKQKKKAVSKKKKARRTVKKASYKQCRKTVKSKYKKS